MPKMKRTANGSGTIYKRDDGRWEGKYSVPAADGSGKYVRKSVYGKTQEEVRKKITEVTAEIDDGTYVAPSQYKMSEWIDLWLAIYVKTSVKTKTLASYTRICNNHIKPALGRVPLKSLTTTQIQRFYNNLVEQGELSAKTIKNVHGVLHRALEQAFLSGEIKHNPSERCSLPKAPKPKIVPMENEAISTFLETIRGHKYEIVYFVTLFTGLRQGEVLGLSWDCVDFATNTLLINKQLRHDREKDPAYGIDTTKSGKERYITVAPAVMDALAKQKAWQDGCIRKAGSAWENEWNLVFTNELGRHLCHETVYRNFKRIVKSIGIGNTRFHDLRHTYAVVSLESGDDIKTVQEQLGHATAGFTLDNYGHVSKLMKQRSAANMQRFINKVS